MIKRLFISFLMVLMLASVGECATINRYVNKSSSGGDGTTTALTGANAAYASLSACEAAEDGVNHAGNYVIINCAGATDDTTGVTFDTSWTADSIKLVGDWDGNGWNTNAYILDVDGVVLLIQDPAPFTIERLQVNVGSAYDECVKFDIADVATLLVDSCYFRTDNPSTGCYGLRCADGAMSAGSTLTVRNTISAGFTGSNSDCYNFNEANLTVTMDNCVAFGAGRYGVIGSAGTVNIRNSVAANTATTDFSSCESVTYSASDDTTAGTGNIDWDAGTTDYAAAFTDYTTGDFSVKDINASIYDTGTDLSGTFTTDITGYTRSTWDIGAFELVSAEPPATSQLITINIY